MYEDAYSISWDNLVKGITIGVFVLLASLIIILALISKNPLLTAALIAVFSAVLFVPYLWAPRGYKLHDNQVIIKRPIGDARIIIAQAASRWKWTWWGLRLFGSGGMYGYYGLFTFKGTGMVRMHATNKHKLVLITDVKGKKYLLSPDDPERFVQQTQTRLIAQPTLS
jgi:hypothetical protein